jgi:phytanoyl-CoA hydroxylase
VSGLSERQLEQFYEEGYLVVEDLVDSEAYLAPMVEDYEQHMEQLVTELVTQGRLTNAHQGLPFTERLTRIYGDTQVINSRFFDFSLPLGRKSKPDEPCFFPDSVFNVLRHPGILDVVESLIGPEIYSNPVQHVRLKLPEQVLSGISRSERSAAGTDVTLWHQDASVVIEEADETEIITVWLPVVDSTTENGCLMVAPSHDKQGLFEHCPAPTGRYLSTRFFDAGRAIPVPMRRGSVLFMAKTTPHCSLPNRSRGVRWSMDLRYNPIGQPTGRPEFPGFVARSRSRPEHELRDPNIWRSRWMQTRERLAADDYLTGRFGRHWSGEGCA